MEPKNQIQASKPHETQLAKPNPNSLINYVRTDEEKELVVASGDVKIKDVNKADAERLIEVVGKWGYYMGASNRQTSEDILQLCKFLREIFGNLTINEIQLALHLNLKGVLGTHEFYGQLSPLFMSAVLNSYIEYKKELVKPIFDRRERENLPTTKPLTKEETYRMITEQIKYEYLKYKKGIDVYDLFTMIYDFLTKSGRLTIGEETMVRARGYAQYQQAKGK